MARIEPVSKKRHSTKSWNRPTSFAFAARRHIVPIAVSEIAKAALSLPMAFIKARDQYVLIGMLSLAPGRNWLVAPNGKWIGGYVPATLRGYPFQLAGMEGKDGLVLCVDEDSGFLVDDPNGGEAFFEENGKPSPSLQEVSNFWRQIEQGRSMTNAAVAALADAGLIVPWPVKHGVEEITGLYRVDEMKLRQIDDAIFLRLRKVDAFPVIYGQLISMGNLPMLQRMSALQKKMAPAAAPVPSASDDGEFIRFDE